MMKWYYKTLVSLLMVFGACTINAQEHTSQIAKPFRSTSYYMNAGGHSAAASGVSTERTKTYGYGHSSDLQFRTTAYKNSRSYSSPQHPALAEQPMSAYAPKYNGPRRTLVWDPEKEEYVDDEVGPNEGDTKMIDGVWYTWNGSEWVVAVEAPSEITPIGDLPWLLMLLMIAAYAAVAGKKKNMQPQTTLTDKDNEIC